tara:strand:- start:20221 stop:20985 length:765 start_codon:yes stop_codon:yes gene_type:complete
LAKRVPRKQAERINRARIAAQDALEPGFADDVVTVFRRQGIGATGMFIAGTSDTALLIPASDIETLNNLMLRYETAQWEFTSGVVAPLVDVEVSEVLSPQARRDLLRRAKNINDVTRDRVRGVIERGVSNRLTDAEIGSEIGEVLNSPARGRTIARTELALADQQAATDRYRAAGVQAVEVFDGSGCGWTYHDDPDKANGTIRTLRQAEAQPLSHPNCRRSFMPVTDVEIPDTSEELAQWQQEQQDEWEAEGLV